MKHWNNTGGKIPCEAEAILQKIAMAVKGLCCYVNIVEIEIRPY